jgi:hypothetical protein
MCDSDQGMDFFFAFRKKRCKNATVNFVMPVHVSTCEIWKTTNDILTKFDIWEFSKHLLTYSKFTRSLKQTK